MSTKTTSEALEREAFEAHHVSKFGGTKPLTWREAEGGPYNVPEGMQDHYFVRSTQQAWEAWKARAALHPPGDQPATAGAEPSPDRGRLSVALSLLNECLGPLEVSAATVESEDGNAAIEALIIQVKKFCADAWTIGIDQVAREAIWDSAEVVHPGIDGAKEATR